MIFNFRWDIKCIEILPEYMRYCYQALLDVFDEAKQEMIKEGREFSVKYVIDEVRHTYSLPLFPICCSTL